MKLNGHSSFVIRTNLFIDKCGNNFAVLALIAASRATWLRMIIPFSVSYMFILECSMFIFPSSSAITHSQCTSFAYT